MRIPALLLLPYLAIAASCGGSSSSSTAVPENASSEATDAVAVALPSDDDIIAKLYDPHYSVPNDFFVDERAGTAQSYTVHHVMDASNSYELCTDDSTVAEAWEAADNASRSVSGYYVGAHETERYFEFIRELSYDDDVGNISDLTSPGFARVFKCSNTSRDGVDRSLLSGFAGTINARPLTAERVRDFAEYFWHADGDQVLFDLSGGLAQGEYPIAYYHHAGSPASITRVASSFGEWLSAQCVQNMSE